MALSSSLVNITDLTLSLHLSTIHLNLALSNLKRPIQHQGFPSQQFSSTGILCQYL
uniref:Uncharacterized protein n=1 Tax=Arundo donax TaxID=35708 RepID=A0A0A9EZS4_ARUDO